MKRGLLEREEALRRTMVENAAKRRRQDEERRERNAKILASGAGRGSYRPAS